jgi:hypothetical protein
VLIQRAAGGLHEMADSQFDAILNFNLVCCVVGGFVTLFGLVSYLLKEGFYVTEPCMCIYIFRNAFKLR